MVCGRHSHEHRILGTPTEDKTTKPRCSCRHPHGRKKRNSVDWAGTRTEEQEKTSASCRRPVPAHTEEKTLVFLLFAPAPTRDENMFGVSGTTRKRHEVVLGATHHKCLMPGAWYSVPARTHETKAFVWFCRQQQCLMRTDNMCCAGKHVFVRPTGFVLMSAHTEGKKNKVCLRDRHLVSAHTEGKKNKVCLRDRHLVLPYARKEKRGLDPVPTREEKRLLWYRHHLHTRNDTRHDEAFCFLYPHTQHDDLLFCTRTE